MTVIELGDRLESVSVARFTPGLITELGVTLLGRDFTAADVGQRVAILGEDFARAHYQRPSDALGQFVRVDGEMHTVVGIAPHGFRFPLGLKSLWLPSAAGPPPRFVRAIARLRPHLAFAQAAELTTASTSGDLDGRAVRLAPLVTATPAAKQSVILAIAAMACLLLVGIANASNLALADIIQRSGELAVRRALGASALALVRQLLIETGLRAAMAVALAVLAVRASLDAIASGVPRILTYGSLRPIELDWRALIFAATLTAIMACVAAVAPCVQSFRSDLQRGLQDAVPQIASHSLARNALMVVQLAGTLVILSAAAILVNGFARLIHLSPGYEINGVSVVQLRLPPWRYSDKDRTEVALRALRSETMSLPAVTEASITDGMPLFMSLQSAAELETSDGVVLQGSESPLGFAFVDEGFFSTLRIPMLSGSPLNDATREPRVVITRSLAERLWPKQDAIGKSLRLSIDEPWVIVAGIVADVRLGYFDDALGNYAVFMNRASARNPLLFQMLVVRSNATTGSIEATLRPMITRVLPGAAVINVRSAGDFVADERAKTRFVTQLTSALAMIAIVMSMLGVCGAFWRTVHQRRREIGIRLAVGAEPADVVRMVLVESLGVVAWALLTGLPLSVAASFAVKPFLFEVSPVDPATMSAVVVLLIGCAMAAAYLPARYASRVDPIQALRVQ